MSAETIKQESALVLTKQEYLTLSTTGTLVKDGVTYTYSPNVEYRVKGHYYDSTEVDILLNGKQDKNLTYTNRTATFVSNSPADTGYEDYEYKANLSCPGVTSAMFAVVVYSENQLESNNYSANCETGTDIVTIYSHDNTTTTIPTVIVGAMVGMGIDGGLHIYSSNESEVGVWKDGNTLYERTLGIDINSGRAYAGNLSTLLQCDPDYVYISEAHAQDAVGQVVNNYSIDAKMIAPQGLTYGDYCSGSLVFPHITLPDFSSLNRGQTVIFYNSYDENFYLITTNSSFIEFKIVNNKFGWKNYYQFSAYYYNETLSEWTSVSTGSDSGYNTCCNVSQSNKFKFVYMNFSAINYIDGEYSTTIGTGGTIDVQYFDPATGAYLNNDQSALGNRAYAGQDYLQIYLTGGLSNDFLGDGTTVDFTPNFVPIATTVKVYVNNTLKTLTTDYTYDNTNNVVTFTTAPADGDKIMIIGYPVGTEEKLCIANGSNYPILPMTVEATIRYTKSSGGGV